MFLNSTRIGSRKFVPPRFLFQSNRVISGQHQGFTTDVFFHLFAFIWIPLVIILALADSQIPAVIELMQRSAPDPTAADVLNIIAASNSWPTRAWEIGGFLGVVFNIYGGLLLAVGIAIWSARKQRGVQRDRTQSSISIFWWDLRVGRVVWLTRFAMVVISMFFATVVVQQLFLFLTISTMSTFVGQLPIELMNSDGIGGVGPLRSAINVNAWSAIIFGVLVLSSWYLHSGLPQYKRTDRTMAFVYAAIIVFGVFLPFASLHFTVGSEVEAMRATLVDSLEASQSSGPSTILAQFALRDFKIDVLQLDKLNSPIFILLGQSALLAVRVVGPACGSAIRSTSGRSGTRTSSTKASIAGSLMTRFSKGFRKNSTPHHVGRTNEGQTILER